MNKKEMDKGSKILASGTDVKIKFFIFSAPIPPKKSHRFSSALSEERMKKVFSK